MRIMFLNDSFVRHSANLETHIRKGLTSYASPGTTFELAYPDDLGGGAVLSLLKNEKPGLDCITSWKPRLWCKRPSRLSTRGSMR